jgi:hypothetical protein
MPDQAARWSHVGMTTTPTEPEQNGSGVTVVRAIAVVGAVRGALRSGLLETLSRWQPCTAAELATRAHLVPPTVELTVAALADSGVVICGDGGWMLTASPEAWARLVALDDQICDFVETGAEPPVDSADRSPTGLAGRPPDDGCAGLDAMVAAVRGRADAVATTAPDRSRSLPDGAAAPDILHTGHRVVTVHLASHIEHTDERE